MGHLVQTGESTLVIFLQQLKSPAPVTHALVVRVGRDANLRTKQVKCIVDHKSSANLRRNIPVPNQSRTKISTSQRKSYSIKDEPQLKSGGCTHPLFRTVPQRRLNILKRCVKTVKVTNFQKFTKKRKPIQGKFQLTTLAPESEAKLWSWNCSETVHGMRSPEARLPCDKLFMIDDLLISPSRHTWKKLNESAGQSTIGVRFPAGSFNSTEHGKTVADTTAMHTSIACRSFSVTTLCHD